jgi:hypothetical protein
MNRKKMKFAKIALLGFSSLGAPCLAFAVVAPSGEMLERVNTAFLGNGEIAAPATPTPIVQRWTVQVGAFSDKQAADARLAAVGELMSDGLSQASHLITPLARANRPTLYRARFGNLEQDVAQNICAALSHRGETCFVSEDETVASDVGKIVAVPVLREALDMPTKEETDAILASAPQIPESELQDMRAGFRAAGTKSASRTVVTLARLASAERVGNDELQTMRGGYFTAAGAHFDFGASIQTSVNGQLALLTSVNWTPAGAVTQQLAGLGTSIQNQVHSTLANAGIGSANTAASNAANSAAASAANAAQAGQAAASASSSAAAAAASSAPNAQNTVQPAAASAAKSPQVPGLSGVQIQSPTGGSTQVLANLGGNSIQNIILNSASNQNIVQNTDVTLTIYNFPQWQQQITQNAVSSQLAHEIMAASGLGSGH